MEISICIIVKDEKETLARCLACAKKIADEIIVADTGSTDGSKEIAKSFTDKVYDFVWIDDFSAARNFAFSKASKDFLMWLDADDVLPEKSIEHLRLLKQSDHIEADIIYMPYNIAFDEDNNPTFSYYRERIVRRSANPVWIEPVHEVIDVKGRSIYLDAAVEHRKTKTNPSGRNLKIMEKQLANGKKLSPRLRFYYARELMYNGNNEKAVIEFNGFLNDKSGWVENKICACNDLSVCYEKLKNYENALSAAFKAFGYGRPRSKTLCRIGELFLKSGRLSEAEYWYEAALNCRKEKNLGFDESDYDGFIPSIQLCVIHDKLGNAEKAEHYNDIAGSFKPHSPAYLYNKQYFDKTKRG
jgi:glycosyltransferase involved in cell wall biosynthesis